MSSNPPTDYKRSIVESSLDYIQRIKQQTNYIYNQRFKYDQESSFPPLLGHGFNGGGSSDRSPLFNLTATTGGYLFYEAGGTLQQILQIHPFKPTLTATISIYQVGIFHCSWDPHPGFTSYTINFYDMSTPTTPVYIYTGIIGKSFYTAGEFTISNGSSYRFDVKGDGEDDTELVSSNLVLYFFVARVSIRQIGSLACSWDARLGYTSYTVTVYETDTSTVVHTYTGIVGTSLTTSLSDTPLILGKSYGISVNGDSEIPSTASISSFIPYSFTVAVSEPTEGSLQVTWDPHPSATRYTVRIIKDTSGSGTSYTTVRGATSLTTTGELDLVAGSTYVAVVTGTGLDATASVRSPPFTYTTSPPKLHLTASNYSGSGAWLDESGNGCNATLGSGKAARNAAGNGIVLDGSTFWTFPTVAAGPTWTVFLWYKKTGSSIPSDTYADILTQRPSNGLLNLMIGNFGSTDIKSGFMNGTFYTSAPIPFKLSSWTNIAVTYNGSNLLTYMNGTLIHTQFVNFPSADSGLPYFIGKHWEYSNYVVGEIGELLIYPTVKPPTTIKAFYTSTAAYYPLSASISQSVYTSLHLFWDPHPARLNRSNNVPYTVTYTVRLYTDQSNESVYEYSGISGISIDTGLEVSILNNTLYTFSVTGNNVVDGTGTIVSPKFLSNTLYPSITSIAPFTSFSIHWYPARNAVSYIVQLISSSSMDASGVVVNTYTDVSGTSLSTGVEGVPVNGLYYVARVKVTDQDDTAYKIASSMTYIWGLGLTPLNATLSHNRSNNTLDVSWTRDPSMTAEPFTVKIYSTDQPNVAAATYPVGTASSVSIDPLTNARIYYAAIMLTTVPQSIAYLSDAIPYVKNPVMLLQGSTYSGSGPWGPASLVQGTAQKNSAGNAILFDGATYWTLGQLQYPTYSFWIKTRGIPPMGPGVAGGVLTQEYTPENNQYVSCFTANLTSFSVANRWYYPGYTPVSGISVNTTDYVWNHVLISNLANSASGPRAWINGVYVGQTNAGVGTSGNGKPMSIGRETIGGNGVPTYFVGELGEIAMYDFQIEQTAGANTIYSLSKDLYLRKPLTSLLTQRTFSSLHFLWDAHPGSTSYTINLYTDPSGAALSTYSGITGVGFDTGVEISLLNDTYYTIGVKGDGDASGAAATLSPPCLMNTLYPSLALNPSYTRLNLAWHPAADASTYVVELYRSTTASTAVPGTSTSVYTYTAVSGTSIVTAEDLTLVNASYYFIRVKVTGQADTSYKTAGTSIFVWGSGTNLGLALSSTTDGIVTATWNAASGVYQGYTINIYAVADSSLVMTSSVVSTMTASFAAAFFTLGVSYYATITLYNIPQSAPLKSAEFVYTVPPALLLRATTHSNGSGVSGVWADESGNGYNATLRAGTDKANADGNGVVFDGATYWYIPTIPLMAWTVILWYKSNPPHKNGQYPQLLTNTGSSSSFGVGITIGYQNSSDLTGGYYGNNFEKGTNVELLPATWTHLAFVRTTNQMIDTYVNGSLLGSVRAANGLFTDRSHFHLGKRWDLDEFVVGEVGELRIYNTNLSAASIQALYNTSNRTYASPLVLLRAPSYSGSGPWLDESGNGHTATVNASGTIAKNADGNGIVLDGSTCWSFPNVAAGNSWTVGVWFKQTAPPTGNGASIVTQETSNSTVNVSIGYRSDSTTTFSGSFQSTGWAYGSPIQLTTGQWVSLYVTWDGTNMRTYVNGSLTGTTQPGYTSIDSGLVYTIGKSAGATNYMIGEIGELRIYGTLLSMNQIANYYAATRSTFGV